MGLVLFGLFAAFMFLLVPAVFTAVAADLVGVRDWRVKAGMFIGFVIAVWHLWQAPH